MSANGSRLTGATRQLWNHWLQTRELWRDVKSHEFEQRYLSELLAGVDKTVASIEQLDKLLSRIKQDCE